MTKMIEQPFQKPYTQFTDGSWKEDGRATFAGALANHELRTTTGLFSSPAYTPVLGWPVTS